MSNRVRNIKQLTDSLAKQYEALLDDQIGVDKANAVSKMAGVLLYSLKVHMDYNDANGIANRIDYLMPKGSAPLMIDAAPPKPSIGDLVLKALNGGEAMSEQAVCEKLIALGDLPETYLDDHKHQIGGPLAFIRGALLGLSRAGKLRMSQNEEGRAVFAIAA